MNNPTPPYQYQKITDAISYAEKAGYLCAKVYIGNGYMWKAQRLDQSGEFAWFLVFDSDFKYIWSRDWNDAIIGV